MLPNETDDVSLKRHVGMRRLLFLSFFLANCWMWMQGIHEFGHVLAAVASGGHVSCVVWHLTNISRTDVTPNPFPLFVCWAGPVTGCLIPVFALFVVRQLQTDKRAESGEAQLQPRPSVLGTLQFFCGFCLIANGAYLAVGCFDGVGDAGVLLKHGTPLWQLVLVGGIGITAGLVLWHQLGSVSRLRNLNVSNESVIIQVLLFQLTLFVQQFGFSHT